MFRLGSTDKARSFAAVAVAVVACLSVALALTACSHEEETYDLVEPDTLTVATTSDYAPFESGEGDALDGFDVALAKELSNRLGLQCKFSTMPFDEVVGAVSAPESTKNSKGSEDSEGSSDAESSEAAADVPTTANTCDVAISALTITKERSDQVDFSNAYCLIDHCIVVRSGTYASVDELEDLRIAAPVDTSNFDYAEKSVSEESIAYTTASACLTALQNGEVEAAVVDYPVARTWLSSGSTGCTMLEQVASGDECAIAVSKENPKLLEAVNEALQAMDEDGTLANLQKQYLK